MNYRVICFFDYKLFDLEGRMNEWFKENKIKIVETKFTAMLGPKNVLLHMVMIIYEVE